MVRGCWRSPSADQGRGWSALEACGGSHRGTADCRPLGVTRERAWGGEETQDTSVSVQHMIQKQTVAENISVAS